MSIDVAQVRADFPIMKREINGHRLVYLDSASSSQKPLSVLDAMDHVYRDTYANIHRGVYDLSEETSAAYEGARKKLARFVGATSSSEIIFTRNATEAINLVAYSWGRSNLAAGDVVVLTEMEHHANIVPWQILAAERGIELKWVPITSDFLLDTSLLDELLMDAKLFCVTAMSNVLGTINDVSLLADAAHRAGALILVDACQAIPHIAVNVTSWDADFVAWSSHKMLGPTGLGALWGRKELLDAMPPFMGGGDMISDVRKDGFKPNELPWKFEAGTPAIVDAVGFGAAVDYLIKLGMDSVREHELGLTSYLINALESSYGEQLSIYGPRDASVRGGAVSFLFNGVHAHDVSQVLNEDGVCVRAGHHCAKPLMKALGVPATTRASTYVYNDENDVDALITALAKARDMFVI